MKIRIEKKSQGKTNEVYRIVLFTSYLVNVGGAETIMLEEANFLRNKGIHVDIVIWRFDKSALTDCNYESIIHVLKDFGRLRFLPTSIRMIISLRKWLKKNRPDLIQSQGYWDATIVFLSNLFTKYIHHTLMHGTIMWFDWDLTKYAHIYSGSFYRVRESMIGHRQFLHPKKPAVPFRMKLKLELSALLTYHAIRRTRKVFCLTSRMAWEVSELYKRHAIVLKGAFNKHIFQYKSTLNLKAELVLGERKVLLNVNRLDPRKRIDLLIRSFYGLLHEVPDAHLVIGGIGPEETNLKRLVTNLGIDEKVRFIGFVPQRKLLDYLQSCDVFVHPNWADYAISVYEAIAMGSKVVCTTEMVLEPELAEHPNIFVCDPIVTSLKETIRIALMAEAQPIPQELLMPYTWENYFSSIYREMFNN